MKISKTRLKRLIWKISATTGCIAATSRRPLRAPASLAASIRQRSPALESLLLLILQQISLTTGHDQQPDEAGVSLAWRARQLISTSFHLPLSTSQLAKELHCNADYLGRVFRRVFHLTLTEAIHRQRVRAAEKLLLNDAVSLTEVATRCGFNDVGYFRQIFRKHTGLTPAVWKRRYCKEHINSA